MNRKAYSNFPRRRRMKPFTSSAQTRGGSKWAGVQVARTPNGRGRWLVPAGGSRARSKFLVAFVWQQTSGQTPSPIVSRKAPFLTPPPSSSSDSTFPFQSHLFAFSLLLYPKTLSPQTSLFIPISCSFRFPSFLPPFKMSIPAFSDIAKSANDVSICNPPLRTRSCARQRERERDKETNGLTRTLSQNSSCSTRTFTTSRPAPSRSRASRPTMSPSR